MIEAIRKMNLPNKLTLLRILLVPVYLVFFAIQTPFCRWVALIVFIAAGLTDLFDGRIARARGLVTNFGKFMDPIADKLLVIPALIMMVGLGMVSSWVCIVFVAREFIVSGLRLIGAEKGVVIAAGPWGKAKTVVQIIAVALLTVDLPGLRWLSYLSLYVATLLTVLSCVVYVWNGRMLLSDLEGGK